MATYLELLKGARESLDLHIYQRNQYRDGHGTFYEKGVPMLKEYALSRYDTAIKHGEQLIAALAELAARSSY